MVTSIGDVIKEARLEQGLMYKTLAKQSGISNSTIARIERGDLGATLESALAVVLTLGIPLNSLFERVTGKKFEVDLAKIPPDEQEFPTLEDLDTIRKFSESHFDVLLDRVVDHLNSIFNELCKTGQVKGVVGNTISSSEYRFTKKEIYGYLMENPLGSFDFQYPILIDIEDLKNPVREYGAIIDGDVSAYTDRIMDLVQERIAASKSFDNTDIDQILNFNGKRKNTSIENFKLNDIFAVDSLGPRNGEFFYVCAQFINYERRQKLNQNDRFSRLLIIISRWKKYLGLSEPGWVANLYK